VPDNDAGHPGVPTPRNPGVAIVIAANASLGDPTFRDSVRRMHAEGYPLIKMVEALGLEDDLTEHIRHIVERMSPEVVEGIRKATLEMLDGADNYAMPLDCTVSEAELEAHTPVEVEVVPEKNVRTIHVRPVRKK
jgi:hypothetical protein